MSDLPAFTKLLGVNFLHRSPERSEAELTVREDLCNRRGVLHGGAVMALGDTLGGMTARSGPPDGGGTAYCGPLFQIAYAPVCCPEGRASGRRS